MPTQLQAPKRTWTVAETAHAVGIHYWTLLQSVNRGDIEATRICRRWFFTRPDLVKWLGREKAEAIFGRETN